MFYQFLNEGSESLSCVLEPDQLYIKNYRQYILSPAQQIHLCIKEFWKGNWRADSILDIDEIDESL